MIKLETNSYYLMVDRYGYSSVYRFLGERSQEFMFDGLRFEPVTVNYDDFMRILAICTITKITECKALALDL